MASPCVIDKSCDLSDAAIKIAHGKPVNAGQTQIARLRALLPKARRRSSRKVRRGREAPVPTIEGATRLHRPLNDRYFGAHAPWFDDAGAGLPEGVIDPQGWRGGLARFCQAADGAGAGVQPASGMRVMEEETSVRSCRSGPVARWTRPSASSIRDSSAGTVLVRTSTAARDKVLNNTVSGGVSVNDTLMHIMHENLPFGGWGESGWGATTATPASCA